MWYVSGTKWEADNDQRQHYHHIKYAESVDGIHWQRNGIVCVDFGDQDEYAIARPIVSNPCVFNQVQYLFGFKENCRRFAPYLAQTDSQIVLEVGAGTGNLAPLLPRSATYLWLDNDLKKLQGFGSRWPTGLAILGDATRICLKDKSVDYALCIGLTHHLTGIELPLLFNELARVIRQRLIFQDGVVNGESKISNLLWKYDRGRYPRSAHDLCSAIEPWFEIEQEELYTIYHRYILCVGKPRHRI
jgi:SAM-dependent methyltransferase